MCFVLLASETPPLIVLCSNKHIRHHSVKQSISTIADGDTDLNRSFNQMSDRTRGLVYGVVNRGAKRHMIEQRIPEY